MVGRWSSVLLYLDTNSARRQSGLRGGGGRGEGGGRREALVNGEAESKTCLGPVNAPVLEGYALLPPLYRLCGPLLKPT